MIILHMCNINDNHMIHVSEISSTTDKIICHFGLFFALLPLKIPKKQNLKKLKKNAWRYYHFTHVIHK